MKWLNNMKWVLSVGVGHFTIGWRVGWAYHIRTLLDFSGALIVLALQVALWSYLTQEGPIGGYDSREIISYFLFMYVLGILYSSSCDAWLNQRIVSGDIIFDLMKPVSPIWCGPFEMFGIVVYKVVITALPVAAIMVMIYHIHLSLLTLVSLILLIVFSIMFFSLVDWIFGTFVFHTKAYWGISSFKAMLMMILTGRVLPMEFYPEPIRSLMIYNPFSISYYWVGHYLSGADGHETIAIMTVVQFGYVVLTAVAATFLWKRSLHILSIQGG